ncbi:LysR family transcriptional regulator [Bradyrhizobium sp. RD5-C2]|uniref:LysR family transcriptional regulator n=1 Tax=Bradyrhizobium sp. RD5-C2 TaxID=244562 RepID=UPI001CC3A431|nr:LysR family transcriptional regulator [Bradyrhizobium sp. RD5-C2]GIQ78313.1 LysR family transcriptional regulator [Bradyrhizobium sp. RD5-C2]
MDRFEAMSIVLAVAEAGSLSAAARRQKAPLPTVSRKVAELEAHLQTKLFNRSSRMLVPTDAGRSYIAAAKRILADLAETERAASGEYTTPRGDLVVSAPIAMGRLYLQPIVMEFLAKFPEVDVQLGLQDRPVNFWEEQIDVALRIGELTDSSLIAVKAGEIRRVMCASPDYLKSRGAPRSPGDLSTHDCITYPPMHSPSLWRFKRDKTEYAVPVRSRLVVSNTESASDAARAGLGLTVVFSYQVAELIRSGELIPVLQDVQPPALPVNFVYSPNRFMPVKLRAFLDLTVPRFKARLGSITKQIAARERLGGT